MKIFVLYILTFFVTLNISAAVKLPRLISDGMVLQRDVRTKIWGWADKNEIITVRFNRKSYRTKTGTDGKWSIQLPAMKAGGPYTLQVDGSNQLKVKDILFGDVWICSGQSNMVHQMILHRERYQKEIDDADYSSIRHFTVPTQTDLQQARHDLPGGSWKSANSQDVLQFSVVAYFFAKKIYQKYRIPIGLINASVGGTPIEAWTSADGLKEFKDLLTIIQKNKDTAYVNERNRIVSIVNPDRQQPQDKGLTGTKPWFDTTYVPKGWRNINIPGYWEDQGIKDLNGVVWYRKEIDVPSSMIGIPAKVYLGRIVDADFLYINGVLVANTTYQYPQRRYQVPAGILKPGKNIFTIRVINNSGKGGFVPDKPYYITAGGQNLDLKGEWKYKVGEVYTPQSSSLSAGVSIQNQPTALFNAMISPLTDFAIKGILWYQGESNTNNAERYEKFLPALISDWRKQWKQANVPFLFVQLPNFMEANYLPSESQWARLRESQLKTLSIPNTAMAITIDLGEWNDIHPGNKKDVGDRLALAAMKVAYEEVSIVHSGPIFNSFEIQDNKIILTFLHTGSGLITNDGEDPSHFAIAGSDKKFIWAKAKIERDKVIVWHDELPNPIYVRYAWADNPDSANLYNREGLPASPFRTDK